MGAPAWPKVIPSPSDFVVPGIQTERRWSPRISFPEAVITSAAGSRVHGSSSFPTGTGVSLGAMVTVADGGPLVLGAGEEVGGLADASVAAAEVTPEEDRPQATIKTERLRATSSSRRRDRKVPPEPLGSPAPAEHAWLKSTSLRTPAGDSTPATLVGDPGGIPPRTWRLLVTPPDTLRFRGLFGAGRHRSPPGKGVDKDAGCSASRSFGQLGRRLGRLGQE